VQNKALTITLPSTAITVGSWTAAKKGTMTFSTGTIAITLDVDGMAINGAGTPHPAAVISKTAVS
jgi:hypothetical protein